VAATPYLSALESRRRELVTPEGLTLSLTVAGRGARFGALMMDYIIISAILFFLTLFLLYLAFGVANLEQIGNAEGILQPLEFLAVIWLIAMFVFRYAYFLYFEIGPRGATWGKRMMGIRIAARDGGRLTAEAVIARNLLRDIEIFMPIVMIVGAQAGEGGMAGLAGAAWFAVFMLFPFFNKDGLRAGDLIAGTWVAEAPRQKLAQTMSTGENGSGTSQETGAKYQFGDAELAVYGEYELQTLERVLRDNQHEAITTVAQTICTKIGWSAGQGDERAFLDAFYTQLRAKLERDMRFGKRKADKNS
jgi:uncharacterized RDD family membrane protein YckC